MNTPTNIINIASHHLRVGDEFWVHMDGAWRCDSVVHAVEPDAANGLVEVVLTTSDGYQVRTTFLPYEVIRVRRNRTN